MQAFRTEHDLLGDIQAPADALYGAQTQRAVENFPVHNQKTLGDYPALVWALLTVKRAAASANAALGLIGEEQAGAIERTAIQLLEEERYDQFPIHYLHGGGGTSANMNANEVLANLGEELLGGRRGQYLLLHPNNHVNLNQSTNDVYPTACHLAVLAMRRYLAQAFGRLHSALSAKSDEIGVMRRLARTCLQDAVDATYGDLFAGYLAVVERSRDRLNNAVDDLATVTLGGTIVGRAQDTPAAYRELVIQKLDELVPGQTIRACDSLFDGAQNIDDMLAVSAQLDLTARSLIKIAKDLRILSSGPEGGLGEIILPAMQPGSSIMPGKINPVIPEFVIQVGFRVIGNHQMAAMALDHGELDLNVWESPVLFGILDSMELLETAMIVFAERCIAGLQVDVARSEAHAKSIIPLLTRLAREHGYSTVSAVCHEAAGDVDVLRGLLRSRGLDTPVEPSDA